MHKAKEDLLVLAAQQGNEQAFTFLCRHYHASLLGFAYKLCGDEGIAHDGVQNAWVKLTKNLRSLDDPRAFKSWVFKTVRWSVYDLMRKSGRDNSVIESGLSLATLVEPHNEPDERVQLLSQLLKRLPDIDRQVVHLFYLEEMKIGEVAEVLQIPIGTVKSRLNRARNALKVQIDNRQES